MPFPIVLEKARSLEILRAARTLIDKPEAWTKGRSWRDVNDEPVYDDTRKNAIKFCSVGAIAYVCDQDFSPYQRTVLALSATLNSDYMGAVINFNDRPATKHAEVLDLFDKTIARLESEALNG